MINNFLTKFFFDIKLSRRFNKVNKENKITTFLNRFSHFQRHLDSHTAFKKHQCSMCGQRFHRKDNLKSHMKTHKTYFSTIQQPSTSQQPSISQQIFTRQQIFTSQLPSTSQFLPTSQQLVRPAAPLPQQLMMNRQKIGWPYFNQHNSFGMSNYPQNRFGLFNKPGYNQANSSLFSTGNYNSFLNNQVAINMLWQQTYLNCLQQFSRLLPFSNPNFPTQGFLPGHYRGFRPTFKKPVTSSFVTPLNDQVLPSKRQRLDRTQGSNVTIKEIPTENIRNSQPVTSISNDATAGAPKTKIHQKDDNQTQKKEEGDKK